VKDASIPPDLTTQMRPAIEQDLQLSITMIDPEIGAGMRQMISYHFGWGDSADPSRGKRLRPLLHLLSCAAAGGEWSIALPTASCIELIHNFTLIHDDIEDNSQLRRGRQTVWHVYGVPQAINTGDAMLILAQLSHQRLAASGVDPATVLAVHGIIDRACLDLTLGQFLDLAFESRPMVDQPSYLRMIEGKTAALLAAATQSGAIIARAESTICESFRLFGRHLGLAFQIQDDILGIWGTPEITGKPAGDDLISRKKSLPTVFGLSHSNDFEQLWKQAGSGDPQLQAMKDTLQACGARTHAERLAQEHIMAAIATLEGACPSSSARHELEQLALRLVGRQK
jgi:geranylgeranyl diphosphate synthase type I